MSWKNYFYFDKRDKNAIILLLVLVSIALLIYVFAKIYYMDKPIPSREEYSLKQDTVFNNYNKFREGEVLDLNEADTVLLKKVPGIGSAYAARIIGYRELLGGYVSVEQLREVWGVDEKMYEKITPFFKVNGKPVLLDVNRLEYRDLIRHPYLNKDQVKVILDLSRRKQNLTSMRRLSMLEEFTDEDIRRLEPYLSFE